MSNSHYIYQPNFGHHVWGNGIGETWLYLVKALLDVGKYSYDEGRKRIDIQNVRIKSKTQLLPDQLIKDFGNKSNLESMIKLTFGTENMYDFDIVPSFPPGADSYYKRIKDGKMIDFVIKRLTRFPESKKAVIVFPNYNDYKAVLAAPKADYLPCITSIQYRLVDYVENKTKRKPIKGYILNTLFNARSIDAFQKSYGNFWAIAKLSEVVANKLEENLKVPIKIGPLDGLITDAHIYQECLDEARKVIKKWGN